MISRSRANLDLFNQVNAYNRACWKFQTPLQRLIHSHGQTRPALENRNSNVLKTRLMVGLRAASHRPRAVDVGRQDRAEPTRERNAIGNGGGTIQVVVRRLRTGTGQDGGRWRCGESLPGLPTDLYNLFPDRLVGSELGDIPEGWEAKELRHCTDVERGLLYKG